MTGCNWRRLQEAKWSRRLLLVAALALPIFMQLGNRGLNEPDEGRYAEIAREMAVTGDWLYPRIDGVPHYAKPPLAYWLIAVSFRLFGVNEFAARLPSALAALGVALLLLELGTRSAGRTAGVVAAFVWVTCAESFLLARVVTTDMLLCLCCTAALHAWWRIATADRRSPWHWAAFWTALGAGFLTKGPPALGVVFLAVLGHAAFERSAASLRRLRWSVGPFLFAAIALPWFLVLVWRDPTLLDFYFGHEIVGRIVDGNARQKPVWWFLAVLPLALWPWTAVAVSAAVDGGRRAWRSLDPNLSATRLTLAWFVLPFVMFSVSKSKLWTYILPIFPAMAWLIGMHVGHCLKSARRDLPRWVIVATWIILPAVLFAFLKLNRAVEAEKPALWLTAAGVVLAVTAIAWFVRRLDDAKRGAVRLAAVVVVAFAIAQGLHVDAAHHEADLTSNSSWRRLLPRVGAVDWVGVRIGTDRRAGGEAASFRDRAGGVRLATWRFRWHGGSFYAFGERPEVVAAFGSASLWELAEHRAEERPLGLQSLVDRLVEDVPMAVVTKPDMVADIVAAGAAVEVIAKIGSGKSMRVVVGNRALQRRLARP